MIEHSDCFSFLEMSRSSSKQANRQNIMNTGQEFWRPLMLFIKITTKFSPQQAQPWPWARWAPRPTVTGGLAAACLLVVAAPERETAALPARTTPARYDTRITTRSPLKRGGASPYLRNETMPVPVGMRPSEQGALLLVCLWLQMASRECRRALRIFSRLKRPRNGSSHDHRRPAVVAFDGRIIARGKELSLGHCKVV
jgi:hypothetical protein